MKGKELQGVETALTIIIAVLNQVRTLFRTMYAFILFTLSIDGVTKAKRVRIRIGFGALLITTRSTRLTWPQMPSSFLACE